MIDLHLHTTWSDGVSEVADLIREGADFGLEAIAITDHDNTGSYALAVDAAKDANMEVIPGIEINTVWEKHHQEVHVLGYYIDPYETNLQAVIETHRQNRYAQIEIFAEKLQDKGIDITYDDILAQSRDEGSLGRPHIARALMAKGKVATISDAFNQYLTRNCDTYVKRKTVSPHEAVEAIYESGGIPVIAHPGEMEHIETLVEELLDYGLRGLEAYHKSHRPAIIQYHCDLAERHGLIVTGGTDYHGEAVGYKKALGRLCTPSHVLTNLHAERDRRQKAVFKVS
jgi:predicted metal-dependent phosphoesterase TrpH